MANKAIISLSGGLDSTCLLLKLLSEGYEIKSYSFKYGQKHSIELDKVKKNIKLLKEKGFKLEHQIIDLTDVFSDSVSSLCEGNGEIPKGDEYNETNISSTVVENRNVIFSAIIYGKALSWANKTKENVVITQGVHAGDHFTYPDTRPESVNMAKELYRISNIGSERVDFIAPFVDIDKTAVLTVGMKSMKKMGLTDDEMTEILRNTHSCYEPDQLGRSCGACATCIERKQAFNLNGMIDPIEYVN